MWAVEQGMTKLSVKPEVHQLDKFLYKCKPFTIIYLSLFTLSNLPLTLSLSVNGYFCSVILSMALHAVRENWIFALLTLDFWKECIHFSLAEV